MDREQLEMLKALQAVEFTAVEFNLYLDTHPSDQRALFDFANTATELQRMMSAYSQQYGPLFPTDNLNEPCWRWIEDPWPWQIDY